MKAPRIFEPMLDTTEIVLRAREASWHRPNHDSCYHPWYQEPVPNSQRAEDLQLKLERLWLKKLPAEITVSCLNGLPTSAEERLHTVEQILGDWYGITYKD